MRKTDATTAARQFSALCTDVAYGHERLVITRHGNPVAALVPYDDLELLERIEDRVDLDEAREALVEYEADPRSAIEAEELYKRLGL